VRRASSRTGKSGIGQASRLTETGRLDKAEVTAPSRKGAFSHNFSCNNDPRVRWVQEPVFALRLYNGRVTVRKSY
jgi:hypothetical protein